MHPLLGLLHGDGLVVLGLIAETIRSLSMIALRTHCSRDLASQCGAFGCQSGDNFAPRLLIDGDHGHISQSNADPARSKLKTQVNQAVVQLSN